MDSSSITTVPSRSLQQKQLVSSKATVQRERERETRGREALLAGRARLSHYPLMSALINALPAPRPRAPTDRPSDQSCFWQCGSAFMTNGAQFGWPNGCAAEAGNSGIDELFVGRSVGRSREKRERGRASSIQGRLATICLQLERLALATQTQSADNDMRVNGRARARAVSPFCTSLLMRRERERERERGSPKKRRNPQSESGRRGGIMHGHHSHSFSTSFFSSFSCLARARSLARQ